MTAQIGRLVDSVQLLNRARPDDGETKQAAQEALRLAQSHQALLTALVETTKKNEERLGAILAIVSKGT
jgi:hypothetical protein